MRTLILGAGVTGSFNAARLTDAGQDITSLARGRRLQDLRRHGIVLEDSRSGRRTITQVQLVDRLGPDYGYDVAIVAVKTDQLSSTLPVLAQNHRLFGHFQADGLFELQWQHVTYRTVSLCFRRFLVETRLRVGIAVTWIALGSS